MRTTRSTTACSTRSTVSRRRRSSASPCGCGTGCRTACPGSPRSRSRATAATRAASIAGPRPAARGGVARWEQDHGPARTSRSPSSGMPRSPADPARRCSSACPIRTPTRHYVARFTAPEFTCLCPVTGQPDFAHLVIDYVPGDWLVESKSLKLYLASFRNHGAFHEDCTVAIGKRIVELIEPALPAHRRLLVSARRHADRRVLADGHAPRAACGCPTRASRPIAAAASSPGGSATATMLDVASHAISADWRETGGSGNVRFSCSEGEDDSARTPSRWAYSRASPLPGWRLRTRSAGLNPQRPRPPPRRSRSLHRSGHTCNDSARRDGVRPTRPPQDTQTSHPEHADGGHPSRQARRAPDRGPRARD